jgi:hypothetical protein
LINGMSFDLPAVRITANSCSRQDREALPIAPYTE